MKLIAVSGLKGGVGAATVAANLTSAFHSLNKPVVIVDLDARNFIRTHFSMAMSDRDGWAVRASKSEDWALACYKSPEGIPFLPLGERAELMAECDNRNAAARLVDMASVYGLSDSVFQQMLAVLSSHFEYIILHFPPVTFSADASTLLQSLHAVVDLHIMVVNPDTACYSILNSMGNELRRLPKLDLLSNKFFLNSEVSADFSFNMKKEWGDILIPNPIHFDEALAESVANLQTVDRYSPYSQATSDFKSLALWSIANLSRAKNA